jgi:hypothetical protein
VPICRSWGEPYLFSMDAWAYNWPTNFPGKALFYILTVAHLTTKSLTRYDSRNLITVLIKNPILTQILNQVNRLDTLTIIYVHFTCSHHSHVVQMERYSYSTFTYSKLQLECSILFHACYTPHLILDFHNRKIWHKDEMITLIMMQRTVNESEYVWTLSRRVRKIAKGDY